MDPLKIVHVYVVRRNLEQTNFHYGLLAHSAILVRTQNGQHFIIEYTKKASGGGAQAVGVSFVVIKTHPNHEDITCMGYTWTKQKYGKSYQGNFTVKDAVNKMNQLMPEGYQFFEQEYCHTAQERLRKEMGVF